LARAALRAGSELESEINLGGNLRFFTPVIEAEHVDLDDPRTWVHLVEMKRSVFVGDGQ
jgi:hypothetical protein